MENTIPFEYFDTRVLKLFNLENIAFPEGDLAEASISFRDASSCSPSNLKEYSVGYHYYDVEDPSFIKDLCKYVYDQGIKYGEHDFEELYSEESLNYYGTGMDIHRINAYVTINGVKYNVKLQGQRKLSEPKFWFVHLNIYARD